MQGHVAEHVSAPAPGPGPAWTSPEGDRTRRPDRAAQMRLESPVRPVMPENRP